MERIGYTPEIQKKLTEFSLQELCERHGLERGTFYFMGIEFIRSKHTAGLYHEAGCPEEEWEEFLSWAFEHFATSLETLESAANQYFGFNQKADRGKFAKKEVVERTRRSSYMTLQPVIKQKLSADIAL